MKTLRALLLGLALALTAACSEGPVGPGETVVYDDCGTLSSPSCR